MSCIVFIIGVSGCGKSTIGKLLSQKTSIPFFDGDDFHPEVNIKKMMAGKPLNDDDRQGWLKTLNQLAITETKNKGAIIACSALKEEYRNMLSHSIFEETYWVFLDGSHDAILERMNTRDHFMPQTLLQSQFDTLEIPSYGLHLSIEDTPDIIVKTIQKQLSL